MVEQCLICRSELRDDGNKCCIDCAVLVDAAMKAMEIARTTGVPKYGPNVWQHEQQHLTHALTHVYMHRRDDKTEPHLAHAICRLVMEYARAAG